MSHSDAVLVIFPNLKTNINVHSTENAHAKFVSSMLCISCVLWNAFVISNTDQVSGNLLLAHMTHSPSGKQSRALSFLIYTVTLHSRSINYQ